MVEQANLTLLKYTLATYLLLVTGLFITGYISYAIKSEIESDAKRQFSYICKEFQLKIESRLQSHKQVLLGGVSLFNASVDVTRNEWQDYAQLVEFDQHFKGIQGLGFAKLIKKADLPQHIKAIRLQGFPDYHVFPPGERDIYSPIIYLEPFKDRNIRAFGYDMYAEPLRRAAMQQAGEQNQITLSGKVTLVQETNQQTQPGTLMYAPVYQKKLPIETVSQRRQALLGWVYSPFRMVDFFNGIIDDWYNPNEVTFNLQVYDGLGRQPENLLYSRINAQDPEANAFKKPYTVILQSDFNGHPWSLVFAQTAPFKIDYSKAWLVLLTGAWANFLLFWSAHQLEHKHHHILNSSNQAHLALDQKSQELERFFEVNIDLLCIADLDGRFLKLNPEWQHTLGYGIEELINGYFLDLIHPDDLSATQEAIANLSTNLPVLNFVNRYRHQNGSYRWLEWRAVPSGHLIFAAARDITARKQTEETLRFSQERLAFALQGATDGFWDWNLETGYVFYSPRWQTMLGYQEHELPENLGTWERLVDPEDRDRVLQHAQDYLDGKLPKYEIEFRMRHKEGYWVSILARAKLAADAEGNVLVPRRLIGTHVDITERKQQEQYRITEQIKLRDTLVKEVHHRIKNNMQGIAGVLRQFAHSHPQLEEPINHAISQMQAIGIIHGLQGSNHYSKVNLSQLIQTISIGISGLWHKPIEYQPGHDSVSFIIEENEAVPIALVLNELILNAIKHSQNQTNVAIQLKPKQQGIEIQISNTGLLPADFENYRQGQTITGLNLVTSLLPRTGAKLHWLQQGNLVLTRLWLEFPIIKQET